MRCWECMECEYRFEGETAPDKCPICDEPRESFVETHPIELDQKDKLLLNEIQSSVPLSERPFLEIGRLLSLSETDVIERIRRLKSGAIRQISAIFDSRSIGYRSTLVAFKLKADHLEEGARVVSSHPGVSHNYRRNHPFNLWFTLTIPGTASLEGEVDRLKRKSGAELSIILPTIKLFKIGVKLDTLGEEPATRKEKGPVVKGFREAQKLTDIEISAIRALQRDLPLIEEPFHNIAEKYGEGLTQNELFEMARDFQARGVMRRYSAVLRHRSAGFSANAMGVWVIPDERMEEIGNMMAEYAAVSHCYQRPAYPPDWPFNMFSMVHGRSVEECESVLDDISRKAGISDYAKLYSTREYKKVRVKYFTWTPEQLN